MENLFNNKSIITNESDLSQIIKKITEGDIKTYCDLKNFFLYRFPLIPLTVKEQYKQYAFDEMKRLADKEDNGFAKAFTGWMLWTGIGTRQNDELAKIYFNNSAKEHNPVGLVELGICHLIGCINGKPDRYSAVNLFEEAVQVKSNGYAALLLGILNEYDNNNTKAINYLKTALSMEISDAASQLGTLYIMYNKSNEPKGDANLLFSITMNIPASVCTMGYELYGKDPTSSEYIKAFQCFLLAQALDHPFAQFYISRYKRSSSSGVATLCSEIEVMFNRLVNEYEQSKSGIPKTAQDIFNEMNNKFDDLASLNITKPMVTSNMTIDDLVNFVYYLCELSSNLKNNLQISTEEKFYRFIVEVVKMEMIKLI